MTVQFGDYRSHCYSNFDAAGSDSYYSVCMKIIFSLRKQKDKDLDAFVWHTEERKEIERKCWKWERSQQGYC